MWPAQNNKNTVNRAQTLSIVLISLESQDNKQQTDEELLWELTNLLYTSD